MMNEMNVKVFSNDDFEIRVVTKNNELWFVGKDAAEILGYSNTRDALAKHVDIEDKADVAIHDGRQNRSMTVINESGLYSLIFSSKLPSAKRFKRWVTSEVLPKVKAMAQSTQTIAFNSDAELVEVVNNQVVVSSKQVAESFGKLHKDVLESIEKYIRAENSALTNWFHKTYYQAGTGKQYPMYLMNRDGFSLLVMGFTGEKALEWKIKYIEAFNKMEKHLKMNSMLPDFTNPVEAAKAWIKQYEEKEQLQKQLEEAKPKADFADAITACKTSIPVGLFAKTIAKQLNIGRNRLFEKLREWNLLMTLPSEYNKPTQKAIDLGIFEMEEKQHGVDTFRVKVKVTPKGQIYIYKRLKGYVDTFKEAKRQIENKKQPIKMIMPTEFQIFKKAMEC